jgi:hypothetical protein
MFKLKELSKSFKNITKKFNFSEKIILMKDSRPRDLKSKQPEVKEVSKASVAEEINIDNAFQPHKSILPFIKDVEKCYKAVNKTIYYNSISTLIKEKINYLENEINKLSEKENYDNRIKNEQIMSTSSTVDTPKTLFNTTSIKETEISVKDLPKNTLNDNKFKLELLNHYSNLNIDKAFEYYYDNLYKAKFETNPYFINFIQKCFHYDKAEYVN